MIEFQDIAKTYPNPTDPEAEGILAVRGLDLTVARGEVHCLIGSSGCGKTTTLRMVNRLENPTRGRILLDGEDIATQDVFRLRRRIGYVIQTGGLFPHLTVAKNIAILCELEGWDKDTVDGFLASRVCILTPGEPFQRPGVFRHRAFGFRPVVYDEHLQQLACVVRAKSADDPVKHLPVKNHSGPIRYQRTVSVVNDSAVLVGPVREIIQLVGTRRTGDRMH